MTYYKRNHKRQLELARIYRETNRDEINRKQRERYANNPEYREYILAYGKEYHRKKRMERREAQ